MTSYFRPIDTWHVPAAALDESLSEMARDGIEGNEGVALWLGRRFGRRVDVTHVVSLRGPGVRREPAHLEIDSGLLNDVADIAIERGAFLVGQVHSHGPGYGVDLSLVDRKCGISAPYFLSIVAPDYAQRAVTTLADCGVHIFEVERGYRRLREPELSARVHIARNLPAPVVVAGMAS